MSTTQITVDLFEVVETFVLERLRAAGMAHQVMHVHVEDDGDTVTVTLVEPLRTTAPPPPPTLNDFLGTPAQLGISPSSTVGGDGRDSYDIPPARSGPNPYDLPEEEEDLAQRSPELEASSDRGRERAKPWRQSRPLPAFMSEGRIRQD